jgi:hypothetical protein
MIVASLKRRNKKCKRFMFNTQNPTFVGIQYWMASHFEAPSNINLLLKFDDVRNLHKEGIIQDSIRSNPIDLNNINIL